MNVPKRQPVRQGKRARKACLDRLEALESRDILAARVVLEGPESWALQVSECPSIFVY